MYLTSILEEFFICNEVKHNTFQCILGNNKQLFYRYLMYVYFLYNVNQHILFLFILYSIHFSIIILYSLVRYFITQFKPDVEVKTFEI